MRRTGDQSINKLINLSTVIKPGVSFLTWRMLVGLEVITVRRVEL